MALHHCVHESTELIRTKRSLGAENETGDIVMGVMMEMVSLMRMVRMSARRSAIGPSAVAGRSIELLLQTTVNVKRAQIEEIQQANVAELCDGLRSRAIYPAQS